MHLQKKAKVLAVNAAIDSVKVVLSLRTLFTLLNVRSKDVNNSI